MARQTATSSMRGAVFSYFPRLLPELTREVRCSEVRVALEHHEGLVSGDGSHLHHRMKKHPTFRDYAPYVFSKTLEEVERDFANGWQQFDQNEPVPLFRAAH